MRKWVKTLAALSGHSAVQRTRQRQLQRVRKQVAPLCKVRHGRLQPQCQLSRHLDEGQGGAWADRWTGSRLVRRPGERWAEKSRCQQRRDPAGDGHARELQSSTLTAEQAGPSLNCRPRAGACPSHPLPSWVPHHHGVCAPQAVRLAQLAVVVEHLTQHPPPGIQRLRLGGGGRGKPGCAPMARGSSAIRGCDLHSATAAWLWLCMSAAWVLLFSRPSTAHLALALPPAQAQEHVAVAVHASQLAA